MLRHRRGPIASGRIGWLLAPQDRGWLTVNVEACPRTPSSPRAFLAPHVARDDVPQPGLRLAHVPVLRRATAYPRTGTSCTSGSFARGGAGLVITEATAVTPEGRISPADTGHLERRAGGRPGARIVRFIAARAPSPASSSRTPAARRRRAAVGRPRLRRRTRRAAGRRSRPSRRRLRALPCRARSTPAEIAGVVDAFATPRGAPMAAGLRGASSCTRRTATCCTSSSRRCPTGATTPTAATSRTAPGCCWRSSTRCARRGRRSVPLFVRLSATDWVEGGWTRGRHGARWPALLRGARRRPGRLLQRRHAPDASIPLGPGYQVPFAARVRREAGAARPAPSA